MCEHARARQAAGAATGRVRHTTRGDNTLDMTPTIDGGDVVAPHGPDGPSWVAAPGGRRVTRWCLDLVAFLLLAVVVMLVGFGVATGAAGDDDAAAAIGFPAGYFSTAMVYGALAGRGRSLGERATGLRRIRLRDGRPVGALAGAGRMVVFALLWPLVAIVVAGSPFSGSPGIPQGGWWSRSVLVRAAPSVTGSTVAAPRGA